MIIELKKFGTTLTSRQAGKEALAAFRSALETLSEKEGVVIDFSGVVTFSPSWGDEFITRLHQEYGARLTLKVTKNPSVQATLKLLEKLLGVEFKKVA